MGPILFDDSSAWGSDASAFGLETEPTAAARGVLMALALSSLFWMALALAVPLVW
jgi:hypothetical protein